MESCEVLIVGGGPAGSSCARALIAAGIDTCVIDRAEFPRDKICAGWVTPQAVDSLELDLADYAAGRVLQPISGFAVGVLGGRTTSLDYDTVVSYAIRRCEFDDYLLRRSGARLELGEPVESIERTRGGWCINGRLQARLLIGAGGHGCPVARLLCPAEAGAGPIAAQEIEFPMPRNEAPDGEMGEGRVLLLFCRDLQGYGWLVRKGDYLNIGLGRLVGSGLAQQVRDFWKELAGRGLVVGEPPKRFKGHAYLTYPASGRPPVADRALLIGDAAGLADLHSGEGIRTAIESALLAADAIRDCDGDYSRAQLGRYANSLTRRFGERSPATAAGAAQRPSTVRAAVGRWLLTRPMFARRVVVDRWFLHRGQPALHGVRAAGHSRGETAVAQAGLAH